MYVGIAR